MTNSRRFGRMGAVLVAMVAVVAACSSGGTAATASPTAPPSAAPSVGASAAASPSATGSPADASTPAVSASSAAVASGTPIPTGPATLDAPATVEGGKQFEVAWTGPAANGDYVTIVTAGATKWTNEPYFNTTIGSPGKLVAPTTAGAYELWYVSGTDDSITARRPITVTPFTGALGGPDSVEAGTAFTVGWNGPNGPSDYVTIVAKGTPKWTNESYFYTSAGNPGTLVAPLTAGAYELRYVTGADDKSMASAPITVTPYVVTLSAPDSVATGSTFEVTWTGPDGPSDYITIAPAGSKDGTYLSYAYTKDGSPASLKAPDTAGKYEIRYASDRVDGTFKSIPITVK